MSEKVKRDGRRPAKAGDYLAYGTLLAAVVLWNLMVNAAELGDGEAATARWLGSLAIIGVWSGTRALVRRLKRKAARR